MCCGLPDYDAVWSGRWVPISGEHSASIFKVRDSCCGLLGYEALWCGRWEERSASVFYPDIVKKTWNKLQDRLLPSDTNNSCRTTFANDCLYVYVCCSGKWFVIGKVLLLRIVSMCHTVHRFSFKRGINNFWSIVFRAFYHTKFSGSTSHIHGGSEKVGYFPWPFEESKFEWICATGYFAHLCSVQCSTLVPDLNHFLREFDFDFSWPHDF